MLRYLLVVVLCIISLLACESGLRQMTYQPSMYDALYPKLIASKEFTPDEKFLINYTIVRQRAYLGYEVAGKTLNELLALGQQFEREGLPADQIFEPTELPESIRYATENQGTVMVRNARNEKRMSRVLKFSATVRNERSEAVLLVASTFQLFGPFGDHLTTAGYTLNCRVEAGSEVTIPFVVSLKNVQANLLHDADRWYSTLMIEELVARTSVRLSGLSVETENLRNYEGCDPLAASREPFRTFQYGNDLVPFEWKQPGDDGRVDLRLGPAHFQPEYSNEVVRMNGSE